MVRNLHTKDHVTNFRKISDDDISYYYDTTQKIHTIKKFALVSAGRQNFHPELFTLGHYLAEFENTLNDTATIACGIDSLYSYWQKNYPGDKMIQFFTLRIVLAGYLNNVPELNLIENYKYEKIRYASYISSDSSCLFGNVYSQNLTCEQMADIIDSTITNHAKNNRKDKVIGGPIMVLKISPDNQFTWLKNGPTSEKLMNQSDFYDRYLKGALKVVFSSEWEEVRFKYKLKQWQITHGAGLNGKGF